MTLSLSSNARGNRPGEPVTKVWQGCLRKAFFCLFQCKMKCPDGLENLPVFWDFELFTELMVQGVPCERVMHQGSNTSAMLLAPSQLLAVWPHFLLSLSQVCIACLITQLLKHSILIHLCGFLSLSFHLTMIYLLAAPCQKGSFAWTLSWDKGLLKINIRASLDLSLYREQIKNRNENFSISFCFPPDFLACGEKVYQMH